MEAGAAYLENEVINCRRIKDQRTASNTVTKRELERMHALDNKVRMFLKAKRQPAAESSWAARGQMADRKLTSHIP